MRESMEASRGACARKLLTDLMVLVFLIKGNTPWRLPFSVVHEGRQHTAGHSRQ